jgi:hypothetical protein
MTLKKICTIKLHHTKLLWFLFFGESMLLTFNEIKQIFLNIRTSQ